MEKIKKILVTVITVGFVLGHITGVIYAADTTSKTEHKHYVAKTCPTSANDTVDNQVVDGISFYITKINDGKDKSSSYRQIRVKLTASSDSIWTPGSGFTGTSVLSNTGTVINFVMAKNQYYEIYTASTINNTVGIYYYGNDPSKDAYVYIREGVNEEVPTN